MNDFNKQIYAMIETASNILKDGDSLNSKIPELRAVAYLLLAGVLQKERENTSKVEIQYDNMYDLYTPAESKISQVEENIIKDQFQEVLNRNSSFEDLSSPEIQDRFWLFRHGWICRHILT